MCQLTFPTDDQFRIVQFTDLHFTDGGAKDQQTKKLMLDALAACRPDLIVLTGDIVYADQSRKLTQGVIDILDGYGKPWTFCFGNHDTEDGDYRRELFEHIRRTSRYCIAEDAHPEGSGVGDHRIKLVREGKTPWYLYVMDSGEMMPEDPRYYDYVAPDQIAWLRADQAARRAERPGEALGALLFLHIPLPEYALLMERGAYEGEARETVCCPPLNTGLFAALVEAGTFRGVFCGHDHVNDFYGELLGTALVYGRASGYNTYSAEGFRKGARLICLNANETAKFETRVYYEDGSFSAPVTLGSTQGLWLDVE